MSAIAGILLILYGAGTAYFGWMELQTLQLLTHTTAYTTFGIGIVLCVAGLGHFVAPHKSFLMSVPLLVYFHVQCFINGTFIYEKTQWGFQIGLMVVSAAIIFLSYRGYKAKQAAANKV